MSVRELNPGGTALVSVTTIPANRARQCVDKPTRTAVVKVVPAGVSSQTIVTFTNKLVPGSGYLKVCNVAGSGITEVTDFTYTVGSDTVIVPAGPLPGGYCVVVGKFPFASQTATESIPKGDRVSSSRWLPGLG